MNRKGSFFRPKHLFIILIVICILLIVFSTLSSKVNNSVRSVVNTVLMPMQKGLNTLGSAISGKVSNMASLRDVQRENEDLKEELAFLRQENAKYQMQTAELEKYRELLNMKEQYPSYPTIGAHVIGENSSNWDKTVLIDRGSNDGIKVNMNVIAQGGLVGVVKSVTANSSTVRLIIDQDCQVGAMSLLSEETCMVRGDLELFDRGLLIVEKMDKDAKIFEDYKIVTSNKSSLYLPGILIGYARNIEVDANSLTKSGELVPVVDFTHLDSVLVITELKETGD